MRMIDKDTHIGRRFPERRRKGGVVSFLSSGWVYGMLAVMLTVGIPAVVVSRADTVEMPAPDPQQNTPLGTLAENEVDEEVVGNELLLFEEMPVVISAARQAQPINLSAVPVTVITADDIHYSGLTNIPELLQFFTGIDYLPVDRNRPAVGVRGMHGEFSDRTLFLLDGRTLNDPAFGGMEWFRLPVFMEDIERIEIVRGPAGATWGANAFTGVINIITKKASDTSGVFSSYGVNQVGDQTSHVRLSSQTGNFAWKHSVGYQHQKSSEDFLADDDFMSRDFSRNFRYDGQAQYRISEQRELSMGLAYSQVETGDTELFMFWPQKNNRYNTAQLYSRLDQSFDDGGSGHLQWSGTYNSSRAPVRMDRYCLIDNDLEGQINLPWEKHQFTFGGNVRLRHIGTDSEGPEEIHFKHDSYEEQWVGLFSMDRWTITEKLTWEGQIRADWNSGTETDWSGRMAGIYALDDEQDHIVRLGTSKSFRAPTMGFQEVQTTRQPIPAMPPFIPAGLYAINLFKPNGDLDNEETWSLEAGYSWDIARGYTFRIDGYYQRMEDLIGGRTLPDPLGLNRYLITMDNVAGANSYGVETEIGLKQKFSQFKLWYAYNGFELDQTDQNIRAFLPARHKVGVTGRIFLPAQWTLNANYRYTTTTETDQDFGIKGSPSHRVDLTVAKEFAEGQAEVAFGVQNIFNKDVAAVNGSGQFLAFETPGRTYFVRLQYSF